MLRRVKWRRRRVIIVGFVVEGEGGEVGGGGLDLGLGLGLRRGGGRALAIVVVVGIDQVVEEVLGGVVEVCGHGGIRV
jgi:hypothetical protein